MILKVSVSVFLIDLMAYSTILPSNNLYSFDVTGIISLALFSNKRHTFIFLSSTSLFLLLFSKILFYQVIICIPLMYLVAFHLHYFQIIETQFFSYLQLPFSCSFFQTFKYSIFFIFFPSLEAMHISV